MMNPFLTLQSAKKNLDLAKELHNQMNANFLEHSMYDINDALTSILALCDMEQMKSIPKIKKYIERVNGLLLNVQIYQDINVFNVNHVLNNVVDIVDSNFKNKVKIEFNSVPVKALTESNQTQFQHILLYLLIELINSEPSGEALISMSLHQKEADAQIIIKKDNHNFSQGALKEVDNLRENFIGNMRMNLNNNNAEIVIRLPLNFKKPIDSGLPLKPTIRLELKQKKYDFSTVKSFGKV